MTHRSFGGMYHRGNCFPRISALRPDFEPILALRQAHKEARSPPSPMGRSKLGALGHSRTGRGTVGLGQPVNICNIHLDLNA